MRTLSFRKITVAVLMALLCCSAAWAKLPTTYKEFKARYQNEAKTMEGAVKLYFEGVFAFIKPDTRAEAGKMLRYALHYSMPIEKSRDLATFVERMKDPDYNYCFRSYAEGATPENDYKMNPDSFKIRFEGKPRKDPGGYMKVSLRSSGADSPRVIWVKKFDDGLWYVINNAATYVQVREPKAETIRRSHSHDADFDEDEPEPEPEPKPVKPDTPLPPQNPAPEKPDEPAPEWD